CQLRVVSLLPRGARRTRVFLVAIAAGSSKRFLVGCTISRRAFPRKPKWRGSGLAIQFAWAVTALGCLDGTCSDLHPKVFANNAKNGGEIVHGRIAVLREHTMKALRRFPGFLS